MRRHELLHDGMHIRWATCLRLVSDASLVLVTSYTLTGQKSAYVAFDGERHLCNAASHHQPVTISPKLLASIVHASTRMFAPAYPHIAIVEQERKGHKTEPTRTYTW